MVWLVVISQLLGLLTSMRAIMEVRTAQGTIAWVVALNAFPYLSVPAFWIFGRSRFKGYVELRRENLARTNPTAKQFLDDLIERNLRVNRDSESPLLIERLARLPFTTGNDVQLLVNGEATFSSIFAGIDGATTYILIEFYILRDDLIGQELEKRLIVKAREGLSVNLLFDELGSQGISRSYLASLREAGVKVLPFNTTRGASNRWQLNFRNHRKIVVVDGKEAWVGGHNVGDEYLGRDPKIGFWRDTHVKLTGPAVMGVQLAFFEDWLWASEEGIELSWDPKPASSLATKNVLPLPSGPTDDIETCTLFFLNAINLSSKRLWIASPYFVPDEQFVSALQLASLRGVDVRILVPEKTDNMLVNLSGWSYVPELETAGIKIFRHQKGFMHQKVMLIDDAYAKVGTANFDNRSFRLNFEITIAVSDEQFAKEVMLMLEKDFADARRVYASEYVDGGFLRRLSIRAARLMAPVQ